MENGIKNNSSPSAWQPCPSGKFSTLSAKLHRTRQRRQFLRSAAVAAGVVAVGGLGSLWWLNHRAAMDRLGNLSCDEVARLIPDYRQDRLDGEMRNRVTKHVANCSDCRSKYPDILRNS